jgi:RNA polymerase sigma factor (sigma-70 family)
MRLFEPFRKSLAKRFIGLGIDEQDICQEVDVCFFKAIKIYEANKDESPIQHLLVRTKLGVWNYYQKQMGYFKQPTLWKTILFGSDDAFEHIIDQMGGVDLPNMENDVVEKIDLHQAIESLPEKYARIIQLYYFDDMDQSEISRIENISQGTVSRRLAAATQCLRNFFNNHAYSL